MLNLEDNYNNDEHDFEEINKTLEQLNPSVMMAPKNEVPNEEKLPFYTKLIMFLCGFSYCGLTIIATIVTLIFEDTFKTDWELEKEFVDMLDIFLFRSSTSIYMWFKLE